MFILIYMVLKEFEFMYFSPGEDKYGYHPELQKQRCYLMVDIEVIKQRLKQLSTFLNKLERYELIGNTSNCYWNFSVTVFYMTGSNGKRYWIKK